MIYTTLHFLHIVGAMGLAATFAIEAATLVGLRRATEADEARRWFYARRWVLLVGPPSIVVLLATGLYAVFVGWGWPGWIVVSLASVVGLALIGGVLTGIPMARLAPRIEDAVGPLAEELRRKIRTHVLSISISVRIAITLGITLLMVQKPDLAGSLVVMAVSVLLGIGAGVGFRAGAPKAADAMPVVEVGGGAASPSARPRTGRVPGRTLP